MTTYLDLYSQIKGLESVFQVPANYLTIVVGTLNVSTGQFTGLKTHSITDPEPVPHRPGEQPRSPRPYYQGETWVSIIINSQWRRTVTVTPAPKVGLAPVLLKFNVVNQGSAAWNVTAQGQTVWAPSGETSLEFNIWDLTEAEWRISCGSKSYSDRIMIQRDPGTIAGVGAFTVPALPLAIVYAPPVDAEAQSQTCYAQAQIVGTTSSFQVTQETEVKKPWLPQHVTDLSTLKTALSGLSTALSKVNNPYAQAVGAVCGQIAGGIGSVSGSETVGTVDTFKNTITVTVATGQNMYAEAANGGPGEGDTIHYLRDAKFAWAISGGRLRLCLLGGIKASYPARYLVQHAAEPQVTGLPVEVTQMLLGLDPFVGNPPDTVLPAPRFQEVSTAVYGGPLEYGGGQTVSGYYSQSFSTTDTRESTQFVTHIQDYNPGWLEKIFGAETQTLKTRVSVTRAAGTVHTDTQTYSWELHSGLDEHFIIEFWVDRVFGTLAMRQQLPLPLPRLEDILKDLHDRPLMNHPVLLTVGGKTFRTVTDASGHYAFYSNNIPKGKGTLQVGSEPLRFVEVGPKRRIPRPPG